jgi:hypothetical protein
VRSEKETTMTKRDINFGPGDDDREPPFRCTCTCEPCRVGHDHENCDYESCEHQCDDPLDPEARCRPCATCGCCDRSCKHGVEAHSAPLAVEPLADIPAPPLAEWLRLLTEATQSSVNRAPDDPWLRDEIMRLVPSVAAEVLRTVPGRGVEEPTPDIAWEDPLDRQDETEDDGPSRVHCQCGCDLRDDGTCPECEGDAVPLVEPEEEALEDAAFRDDKEER